MSTLINNKLRINILKNGAIGAIRANNIMINQVDGNELDGSIMNIYLRISEGSKSFFTQLLGPKSKSSVNYSKQSATWSGAFKNVKYQVQLLLGNNHWYWRVKCESTVPTKVDLTYVQDLGIGTEDYVTSNEAYASQYLDHFITKKHKRITVASRQNQAQEGTNPYLQQGALTDLDSYDTDAYQFFGSSYRETELPEDMLNKHLHDKKMQYESGLVALRSIQMTTPTEAVFYAAFAQNQPNPNFELLFDEGKLRSEYKALVTKPFSEKPLIKLHTRIKFGSSMSGDTLSKEQISKFFPKRLQEETDKGQLLSFFTPDAAHIVLKAKELKQQRSTGNIILAGKTITPTTPVMAATQFMSGIFESHVVFGNTNLQIFTTHTRDALNLFKVTGTRIYLRSDDGYYHVLALPSAFMMSSNGADWIYKFANDTVIVSDDAASVAQQLNLRFRSLNGHHYDVLVTTQWNKETMGVKPIINRENNSIISIPGRDTLMQEKQPKLAYTIHYCHSDAKKFDLNDDSYLFTTNKFARTNQIIASYKAVSSFELITSLKGRPINPQTMKDARRDHRNYTEKILHHLQLTTTNKEQQEKVEQTNLIIRWFAHDALVHLLSPHGLEQYGGAAWGTRDVCQGPTEFFLSLGHYKEVRKIIVTLYSHQFLETGNWPQWFMYDEYANIFSDESHGDIIVWPLKIVADYINVTGDVGVLNEQMPYMLKKKKKKTNGVFSLKQHIQKQLDYIVNHFLPGTYVSAYGDGDWDDTLQPADPSQKKTMASTWTEELTIETLRNAVLAFNNESDLKKRTGKLAKVMMHDFRLYFMKDDVLPGFIKMLPNHKVVPIIHPNDSVTGIDYRLLPLSQGVLSHILEGQEITQALDIIKKYLLFPDGVRLMNRPATYHGGVSKVFKRAEQSANFGREIGLLYVHAHIRYADAVAISGDPLAAWDLLQLVNPIQIKQRVSNAELRQANTYFSSSDADFGDRYEAQDHFNLIQQQKVAVKGGWRLYSSGPGIYIATLLRSIFKLNPNETFNQNKKERRLELKKEKSITIHVN